MQQNLRYMESQFFARYMKSASGFWRASWMAWSLLVLLIAFILSQLLVQYLINFWNRDFFNALNTKNIVHLWNEGWLFLPLAFSSIFIAILSVWAKMTVQRKWREWLSEHKIKYWAKDDHFLRLFAIKDHPQNAEYRIADDARVATDLPFELLLGLFSFVLTAITFISVLWNVGGTLNLVLHGRQKHE